jgi:hypothetical protein
MNNRNNEIRQREIVEALFSNAGQSSFRDGFSGIENP